MFLPRPPPGSASSPEEADGRTTASTLQPRPVWPLRKATTAPWSPMRWPCSMNIGSTWPRPEFVR